MTITSRFALASAALTLLCAVASHAATITISPPPDGGYVSSNVGGLNCGNDGVHTTCTSSNIGVLTSVTLSANPNPGCTFVQWTVGASTSGSNPFPAFPMPGTDQVGSATFQCTPVFTSATATTFVTSVAGSFAVTATGIPAPMFSLAAGSLPAGVTLAANGTLSGTPAANAGGVYNVTLRASNAAGQPTQAFALTVNQPPAITSAASASFTVTVPGSFQLTATGYPAPTFTHLQPFPPNLAFASNGLLSGTPTLGFIGPTDVIVKASNGVGTDATQSLRVTIGKAGQTISFPAPPSQLAGAGPLAIAPSASSGLAVLVASSTTSVCTVAGFSVSFTGVEGICTLTATQAGDYNYDAASPVARSFAVQPARYVSIVAGTGATGFSGDGGMAFLSTLNLPVGNAVDDAGNLYIADATNHRVRRVDYLTGVITTVAGTGQSGFSGDGGPATFAALSYPTFLAIDPAGNLAITDGGNGRVRRVDKATGVITTIAGNGGGNYAGESVAATAVGLNNPAGIAYDFAGVLYIAEFVGNRIRRVASGIMTTFAGTGSAGYNGDGIAATSAMLNGPNAVMVGYDGALYVADATNFRVRRILGGTITTVAGNGGFGYGEDLVPATASLLAFIGSLATEPDGHLFIADNGRIRRVDANTGLITTIAGTGSPGPAAEGQLATLAAFGTTWVSRSQSGHLFVTDRVNGQVVKVGPPMPAAVPTANTIVRFTEQRAGSRGLLAYGMPRPEFTKMTGSLPSGLALTAKGEIAGTPAAGTAGSYPLGVRLATPTVPGSASIVVTVTVIVDPPVAIDTVAGNGTEASTGDGGLAVSASINKPGGVARDAAGNLYVADTMAHRIRRVDAVTGIITTVAGTGSPGFSGDGGPATAAQLQNPNYLAFDSVGNLFFTDANNVRIRRIDKSTGAITTAAGNGSNGNGGESVAATAAPLNSPYGLAFDAGDNLYIGEFAGNRIRKVSGGIITTFAGNGTGAFAGDGGPALNASFNGPGSMGFDAAGNLYVADTANNRLRKIAGGYITTIAGTGNLGNAGDDGLAINAELALPSALAVSAAGDVYVGSNGPIRRIDGATGVITRVAQGTSGGAPTGDGGLAIAAQVAPAAFALAPGGDLFEAEFANSRVRKIGTVQPIAITSGLAASVALGQAGTFTMTATGFPRPTFTAIGSLPIGVSLATTGILSGTPSNAGTFTFTVVAANGLTPADSKTFTLTVKSGQSVTFGAVPAIVVGGTGTASATATSGLAVTYSTASPTCSVNPTSGLVTGLAAGTCTVVGSQAGNATYLAAQASQDIPIGKASQSIAFGAAPTVAVGGTGAVSATATSGLAVTYSTASSTCSVNAASGLVTGISVGSCTIAANQAGNANYNAAPQATQTFPIAASQFALTVAKTGGGTGLVTSTPSGIDCGATCSANYDSGTMVALGAAPSSDSFFAGWSGACTGTGACNVTMDAAKSVTATFKLNTTIPRLANISTRMQVLTGNDVLIGGFIIGGSAPKTVVVRARGPSLIPLGVPNAISNPRMDLFSGQTVIASSDDWGSNANAATIQASGFAPSNPLEAAIHITLGPGAYTAVVSGVANVTGVGIIEVFEVDHPEIPLLNISTRGQVLTGGDVMIGGFIIQGDAPQTVVVRARGPSLVPFGITNALGDPVLQLFSGQTVIASNDDWQQAGNAAQIQSAGFAPGDAKEAAILITLPPGAYTAIVSGKNGGTGVGIIEVFAQ